MKLLTLLLLPTALAAHASFQETSIYTSSTSDTITNEPDDPLKVPGANPLRFCEDPKAASHLLYIEKVDLDPNPPRKGEPLEIKATGNVTKEILDGAYVEIWVRLGRFAIVHRTEDLCSQMKEVDKECPLEKGEVTVTKTVDLPAFIPPVCVFFSMLFFT